MAVVTLEKKITNAVTLFIKHIQANTMIKIGKNIVIPIFRLSRIYKQMAKYIQFSKILQKNIWIYLYRENVTNSKKYFRAILFKYINI